MKKTVIHQLNQLNKDFYATVTEPFSDSRSYYWQGWNKLVPYVQDLTQERERVVVMDVGCGNGRFGLFLRDQLPEESISFVGVDNSQELLEIAERQYQYVRMEPTFITLDLVDALLKDELVERLSEHRAHMIALLGVLHHIPSLELRKKLVQDLGKLVVKTGYLVFTTWNFMESERLQKKIISPEKVGINPQELETHDMILDWQRDMTAHRYCHYANEEERRMLIEASELELASQFTADGKSGRLNTYVVLQKAGSK